MKCFNCGKIGHFAAKCPLKGNQRGTNLQRDFKIADKQTLFTNTEEEGVSNFEEEEEEFFEGNRNEILFLAQENNEYQPELEEGVVDLEAELVATLEEIENLKNLNEKQEQQHQFAKNILVKILNESIQKREV